MNKNECSIWIFGILTISFIPNISKWKQLKLHDRQNESNTIQYDTSIILHCTVEVDEIELAHGQTQSQMNLQHDFLTFLRFQ